MKKIPLSRLLGLLLTVVLIVELGVLFMRRQSPVCAQGDTSEVKLCWEKVVKETIDKGDISGAFDSLVPLYDANPALGETCHALTHEIGQAAYGLFARGVHFAVTPKTAYCSYGFYHGFMEALVIQKGDMDLARRFCDDVDKQLVAITPDATLQCFHGIGHGTVNNHDPRTWGSEQALIDPALALCEQVSANDEQRSRCATGVFNGIAIFYTSGEYKLVINPHDPLRVCKQQKQEYQDACYISMNTLLLQLTQYDLRQAAGYLGAIEDDTIARHAIINLASPIGSRNMDKTDHADVVAVCRLVAPRLRPGCIQGYAFGFLEHGEPEKEYVKPLAFCGSKELVKEEQDACFEYILSYLPRWYAKEKVAEICKTLETPRRHYCEKQINE